MMSVLLFPQSRNVSVCKNQHDHRHPADFLYGTALSIDRDINSSYNNWESSSPTNLIAFRLLLLFAIENCYTERIICVTLLEICSGMRSDK